MTCTLTDLRLAWRDAALALWRDVIRDIEPGQPDERDRIERIWRDLGWGWLLDSRGEPGYDEAPESWCGAAPAWVGRYRLGPALGAEESVEYDVALHPELATQIMPGTGRLYDRARWKAIGLPYPGVSGDELDPDEHLGPGVLVTVGDGPDGSHIVLVDEVGLEAETFTTIEGNGYGELGDGNYGEGVVRRRETTIEDYDGNEHDVEPRSFDEIVMVYPLGPQHFVGTVALELQE